MNHPRACTRYDARKGRFKASDKGCVFVKLADPSRGWALLEEEKLSLLNRREQSLEEGQLQARARADPCRGRDVK